MFFVPSPQAVELYDEALVRSEGRADMDSSELVPILNDLSFALKALGRLEHCEAALRRALELDSRSVQTRANLSLLLSEVRQCAFQPPIVSDPRLKQIGN